MDGSFRSSFVRQFSLDIVKSTFLICFVLLVNDQMTVKVMTSLGTRWLFIIKKKNSYELTVQYLAAKNGISQLKCQIY